MEPCRIEDCVLRQGHSAAISYRQAAIAFSLKCDDLRLITIRRLFSKSALVCSTPSREAVLPNVNHQARRHSALTLRLCHDLSSCQTPLEQKRRDIQIQPVVIGGSHFGMCRPLPLWFYPLSNSGYSQIEVDQLSGKRHQAIKTLTSHLARL
jgi:hypothetical protein